jgi:nucleoside-diphosphate-sugar epimerase
VLDIALLSAVVPKYDAVIHAAGIVSYAPNRYDEMFQINVEGTRNVVNTCVLNQKRLVHVSSVAAIGNFAKEVIDENEKWNDSESYTYYAKTKHLSELEVWRGIEEGLNATIFNPSVVLGIGDTNKSSTKLFAYVKNGGRYYSEGNINYVDVRDVANLIVDSLSQDQSLYKRYILSSGSISYKVFFEKIAAQMFVKAPQKKVTNFAAAIAWRFEFLKYLFTGKEPLITKETARMSKSKRVYDSALVQKDFSFVFTSLDDTLEWCCKKNK